MRRGAGKAAQVQAALARLADPDRALISQRFFKTAPGQYGAGDVFRGIAVPVLRGLARDYAALSLAELRRLLASRQHEDRLLALLILVRKYTRGTDAERAAIYRAYLANTRFINNWDLVDSSAPHIVGQHLLRSATDRRRAGAVLRKLVASTSLWERRIGVLATQAFIRRGDFSQTLVLARALLTDREDLIHKAVGWMLREVGNRDPAVLERFVAQHHGKMPRTMLRYAIEKLPAQRREAYLVGLVAPSL